MSFGAVRSSVLQRCIRRCGCLIEAKKLGRFKAMFITMLSTGMRRAPSGRQSVAQGACALREASRGSPGVERPPKLQAPVRATECSRPLLPPLRGLSAGRAFPQGLRPGLGTFVPAGTTNAPAHTGCRMRHGCILSAVILGRSSRTLTPTPSPGRERGVRRTSSHPQRLCRQRGGLGSKRRVKRTIALCSTTTASK